MKNKKIIVWIMTAALIAVIALRRVMPAYTSVGFMWKPRTVATLGFQKQVIEMHVGDTFRLRVNRINVRVTYSSSDFRIAHVSSSGKITALKTGTVIIYGEIGDDVIKCKVKITER